MLDIRLIREQPDFVKSRLATRGGGEETKIDEVLEVDAERRKLETALQQFNADRKRLSKEIGGARGRGEDSAELEEQVRKIGDEIADLVRQTDLAEERQRDLLLEYSQPAARRRADRHRLRRTIRSSATWGEKPPSTDRCSIMSRSARSCTSSTRNGRPS